MTTLNDLHKRALVAGFLDLHRRMADMESALTRSADSSPFGEHIHDLSPTEIKVVQDYFARLRGTMSACLREHGIDLQVQRTSLRWVLQTGIVFLHIGVEELAPERLRGYGALDESARQEVVKIQGELRRLIERVDAYLRQRLGKDLPQRLARLKGRSETARRLATLDAIINRWQLVEFRPTVDTILQRLESPQFEIAIFGRVNCGKSSLLNRIAGSAVLPVGVTPVTAVPTRMVRGDSPQAVVRFAEMEPRVIDLEDLPWYASEQGNPGNRRHVTSIEVRLPAPHLQDGIVLVDTPGTGSLATTGSAETFAYLPRCDLGVVLIDAATTLTEEDLALLRALEEGGIPTQVLLSKADLLSPTDREQTLAYIRDHVQRAVTGSLPVHAVSTVGNDATLLDQWFQREIEPLFARHRALAEASLLRKTVQLQESIIAVLETMLARRGGSVRTGTSTRDTETACRLLDEADAAIAEAERRWRHWADDNRPLAEAILQDAAVSLTKPATHTNDGTQSPLAHVANSMLVDASQRARQVVTQLQTTLEHSLLGLQQSAPLANIDLQSIRRFACRGLPGVELSPALAGAQVSLPWWSRPIAPLALHTARQKITDEFGAAIREQVQLYNAQLRSWLRDTLRQLVERYQSQAEVLREQLRRLAAPVSGESTEVDADELRRDIEQLQAARDSACVT
jgi:GTP-binding protein EngB required for normal cell division